ncbi:MAG: manganese-binding transcriptional regulator MntR [Fimbriimonadaceae bacterium]|nr:manganese-binding transcriptional regulator MntR [Fimbriimonadaceae bacterium]
MLAGFPTRNRSELPARIVAIADSKRFSRTRQDHSREIAEDYVELVDTLIQEKGEARITDLAERLGVSKVNVSKIIQRLAKEGLVHAEPYRSIFLTPEGEALASESRARHQIVVQFLVAHGISIATAEVDAEGIEHHVSQETLNAMQKFIKKQSS